MPFDIPLPPLPLTFKVPAEAAPATFVPTTWTVTSPPLVCTGTGYQPATVQHNPHFDSSVQHKCGICGQMVGVDAMGYLVLHPYRPVA